MCISKLKERKTIQMKPTPEQQAIIDHPMRQGDALKVIAYAGAGKTSTLRALAEARDDETLYLAFNKSVEAEAKLKFPMNVTCRTGHALAYKDYGAPYARVGNLGNIQNFLLKNAYGLSLYEASIVQTSLERYLCSADDTMSPEHVEPDHLGRFDPDKHAEVTLYRMDRLWRDMRNSTNGMPMTHSGYLKLFCLQHPILSFDTILLDEAQDTNPVMLRLMLDQMKYGKKVYFVGDPYQQIYSWRGALDAMSKIDAPSLRLTQSFRFGPAIAEFGSLILQKMFGEQVPLRGVDSLPSAIGNVSRPYTILCRTNAGLIREAYNVATQGVTISIAGTLQSWQETLTSIEDCWHMYMGNKHMVTTKRIQFHKDFSKLKQYSEEALDVELASKINIAEEYATEWPKVREALNKAYRPSGGGVALSTCHKAKGLEWDHVRIGSDFQPLHWDSPGVADEGGFQPSRQLRKITDKHTEDPSLIHREEVNLLYVACTRAKKVVQLTSDLQHLRTYDSTRS